MNHFVIDGKVIPVKYNTELAQYEAVDPSMAPLINALNASDFSGVREGLRALKYRVGYSRASIRILVARWRGLTLVKQGGNHD